MELTWPSKNFFDTLALLRRAQALYELHSLERAQKDLQLVLSLEPKNSRAAVSHLILFSC